jgi:hypothetical protein
MADFNKSGSKEGLMKMKYCYSILACLCCIVFLTKNTVLSSDEDMKSVSRQRIDTIRHSLELGNAGEAMKLINQLKNDWKSLKPEARKETDSVMSRALYLEAHALYKSGKKNLVPDSLKNALSFDNEQNVLYSPLLDYDFFRDTVTLFVNSCRGKVRNHPEILEHFGMRNFAFSKSPSDHGFVAALFRSNDLNQEPGEFSIVLLYRQNKEGIYEPSELKVPRTKYHTLALEEGTGGIPNIILRKKFGRTGEVETITIGIKDGLKIISQERK